MKSSNIQMANALLRERGYVQNFIDNANAPADERDYVAVSIGGEEIEIPAEHSASVVAGASQWATIRLAEIDEQLAGLGVEIDTTNSIDDDDDMQEAA